FPGILQVWVLPPAAILVPASCMGRFGGGGEWTRVGGAPGCRAGGVFAARAVRGAIGCYHAIEALYDDDEIVDNVGQNVGWGCGGHACAAVERTPAPVCESGAIG